MNGAGLYRSLTACRGLSVTTPFERLLQRRWARWLLFISFGLLSDYSTPANPISVAESHATCLSISWTPS